MKIVNGRICLFATIFLIVLLYNESGRAAVHKSGRADIQRYDIKARYRGNEEKKGKEGKEGKEKMGYVFMFWNLENYYDSFNDPVTSDDEFTPFGERHWSWKKFINKRNSIAKVIISVGERQGEGKGQIVGKGQIEGQREEEIIYPTIVALAEVENRFVLEQLARNTPLSLINYGIIHRDSPDNRGIDVALLYRKSAFRPLSVDFINVKLPDSTAKTRLILYTKGVLEDLDTLHVFINHWPSKFGGEEISRPNREAAAKSLLNKCDSIFKINRNANILLGGDFNDTPDSEIFKDFKDFVNLSSHLYRKREGTIKYMGQWELIDQFFVSKNLVNINEPIYCETTAMKIYRPFFLLEPDKEYLGDKPKRSYIGPRYNGGISDHLPILMTIGKM